MSKLLRLPGLIDIHVHLRDLGQEYKEDFYSGTSAALAGGVTTVFDMPNNKEPIFTYERLMEKLNSIEKKAVCDYGLYFGTDGKNIDQFEKVIDKVIGLKVYLDVTTGGLIIENKKLVERVFEKWPKYKLIIVHAEGDNVGWVIDLCRKYRNKVHITHLSTKDALKKVSRAKAEKLPMTCDATPHHLFLTEKDKRKLGSFGQVKPPLATKEDQEFLWKNLKEIDCIITDHAPHTISEKKSKKPPSGMPGLETMLPLLLTAVDEGKLTTEDIIRMTNSNPRKIFGLDQDEETFVDVQMEGKYMIKNENLHTKCKWSPFEGRMVKGMVKDVYIRGTKVFSNGKILVEPGFGENIIEY